MKTYLKSAVDGVEHTTVGLKSERSVLSENELDIIFSEIKEVDKLGTYARADHITMIVDHVKSALQCSNRAVYDLLNKWRREQGLPQLGHTRYDQLRILHNIPLAVRELVPASFAEHIPAAVRNNETTLHKFVARHKHISGKQLAKLCCTCYLNEELEFVPKEGDLFSERHAQAKPVKAKPKKNQKPKKEESGLGVAALMKYVGEGYLAIRLEDISDAELLELCDVGTKIKSCARYALAVHNSK